MVFNAFNRLISRPIEPFRLLLYLEWLLLGLAIAAEMLPFPFAIDSRLSGLTVLSLVGFGLIGLRLPPDRVLDKVLYTAAEFGCILLPLAFGEQLRATPMMMIILIIRSCQIFRFAGRLIVTGLAFIGFLLVQNSLFNATLKSVHQARSLSALPSEPDILLLKLNTAFSFGLTLVAMLLLVNTLLAEHQSRKQLSVAHEQLRQYAARIEDQATLQERNRIAREIHDTLGHALTAQSIQLENALLFCPAEAEKTQAFLKEAQQLCAKALQDVRQSVATLRSHPVLGRSVEGAIKLAVQEFYQSTGVAPTSTVHVSSSVAAEVSTALYRIIQEALMNVYKHSSATQVAVHVQESDQEITLWIEDNGCGFLPEQNTTGYGIQGMQERVLALKGEFKLVSQPGSGCLITAQIPLGAT